MAAAFIRCPCSTESTPASDAHIILPRSAPEITSGTGFMPLFVGVELL
jgi:hypothetical protein